MVVRKADVYVFCVLVDKHQKSVNPLDLNQWEIYVLGTNKLNQLGPQKTISLSRLVQLEPTKTNYAEIRAAIRNEVAVEGEEDG